MKYEVEQAVAGHFVTHNWPSVIRSNGEANPRDATACQRKEWCGGDVEGILNCEVFWLLLPEAPTICAWVELGIASGLGRQIVISGDWRRTIFSALADRLYDSHDEALNALLAEAA